MSKNTTYKAFESHIAQLEKFYHSNTLVYKALSELFGATSEGMIIEIMDSHIDFMIQQTMAYWGDKGEWIQWYIFENNFGKNGMTASVSGKRMKKIDTVKKLYKIIEETRAQ